jgi:LuxR family transcriptional activator of conjugal transfer of Ti plasmids
VTDRLAERMLAFLAMTGGCRDMARLASASVEAVAQVGMTVIACGMVTGPKAASGAPMHFNNWPPAWLALYQARGFLEKDPVPRWAIVSGVPTSWSALKRSLQANDPGLEVFDAAERFGFREGMVIPGRTAAGHLGLVSVGGNRGALLPAECQFLQTVCTTVLHRAEALEPDEAPRPPPAFSPRERECVALLVQGLTENEIGLRLGIKAVTARFHLDNARAKTGARSRTHLAGIAALWLGKKTGDPL